MRGKDGMVNSAAEEQGQAAGARLNVHAARPVVDDGAAIRRTTRVVVVVHHGDEDAQRPAVVRHVPFVVVQVADRGDAPLQVVFGVVDRQRVPVLLVPATRRVHGQLVLNLVPRSAIRRDRSRRRHSRRARTASSGSPPPWPACSQAMTSSRASLSRYSSRAPASPSATPALRAFAIAGRASTPSDLIDSAECRADATVAPSTNPSMTTTPSRYSRSASAADSTCRRWRPAPGRNRRRQVSRGFSFASSSASSSASVTSTTSASSSSNAESPAATDANTLSLLLGACFVIRTWRAVREATRRNAHYTCGM